MRRNGLLVLEMLVNKRWVSTVCVGLNKADMLKVIMDWVIRNPADDYRVRRYEPIHHIHVQRVRR